MDFQEASALGYYFDRCIDLEFLDESDNLLGKLICPKHGLKPTITIKGHMIPGSYTVDAYILVQNMTYDIDVSSVKSIRAHMYYSGIEEGVNSIKNGHTIKFSVLWLDQDKEPPNRCVKFDCQIASQDTTRYETPMYVSGASLGYDTGNPREVSITDKSNTKTTLKNLVIELANIYNKGLSIEESSNKKIKLKDEIGIKAIEIDKDIQDKEIILNSQTCQLGDFVRELNSTEEANGNNPFKIVIVTGKIQVTKPFPKNWKEIAESQGLSKKEYLNKWFSREKVTYLLGNDNTINSNNQPIPLNYVRYAARVANVLTIETMFDDRIKPECYVKINAKAIMGQKRIVKTNRLINYQGEILTAHIVADIEYLFSTTENSYMKFEATVEGEEKI